jgi:hypothetical protein
MSNTHKKVYEFLRKKRKSPDIMPSSRNGVKQMAGVGRTAFETILTMMDRAQKAMDNNGWQRFRRDGQSTGATERQQTPNIFKALVETAGFNEEPD